MTTGSGDPYAKTSSELSMVTVGLGATYKF